MTTSAQRSLAALVAALLLVALFADTADAQRRRRRGRRAAPPTTEQTETPPEGTEEGAEPSDEATPAGTAGTTNGTPTGVAGTGATGTTGTPPTAGVTPGAAMASEGADAGAEPAVTPSSEFDPGPPPPDVTPVRTDYVTLMDDLVQARMRVSALGSELFRTRITVDLQDRTGERQALARIVVHLDGAAIFQSDGAVEGARDGREIFTGSLAPGPHVLGLEVEQRAREDDAYRYTLRETYRFQVVRERLSEVTLVLEDESDMARSFPSGGEGRYEVRTRVRVATRALPAASPSP